MKRFFFLLLVLLGLSQISFAQNAAPKFQFNNDEVLHQLILMEGDPIFVTLIKRGERSSDIKVIVDWKTYLSLLRSGCSFDLAVYHFCSASVVRVVNCTDCSEYLWSTGATTDYLIVTTAGTYTVTVKNFAQTCTSVAGVTISQIGSPLAVNITGSSKFCTGSNTVLTANAVGATEYCWSTGAKTPALSVMTAGTYTVTVTNSNGCTGTASKEVVMVQSSPKPNISVKNEGNNVELTALPPAPGYIWSNGATTPTIKITTSGTFTVRTINYEGCVSESSSPYYIFVKECSTIGNEGSSPSNCNKNGIWASNGMPYGAVWKATTSQLFLYAPPGANIYTCAWDSGKILNTGWILASTSPGTHAYLLECRMLGETQKRYFCFQYTVVSNFGNGSTENRSSYSSDDIFVSDKVIIPEEYQEEIQKVLSTDKYLTNSEYLSSDKYEIKISPNPTTTQFRAEVQMEIPANQPPGIYILRMFDINGRPVGEPKKIIKQE